MSGARPSAPDIPPDIPFVKNFDFTYGAAQKLSPRVTRVIAENPGPFTYAGSGTYIVHDGGAAAVIDPGPDLDRHFDALLAALAGRAVNHVLITHTHLDHCGLARRVADAVSAPIYGFGPHPRHEAADAALDEGGDAQFRPDIIVHDGWRATGGGWTLEAIHTPGHLSNHLCFGLAEEQALFSGDHIMGWSTTVVAPPDGDMGAYFASLEKLLVRNDVIYYPTHGAPIEKPQAFVRAVRAHRRMRDGQILEALSKAPRRVDDLVAAIYVGLDPRLTRAAALNVLAHLIRLVATGAVTSDRAPDFTATFTRHST